MALEQRVGLCTGKIGLDWMHMVVVRFCGAKYTFLGPLILYLLKALSNVF